MDYSDNLNIDLEYKLELSEYNGMFDNDQKMIDEIERKENNVKKL